MKYHVIVIGAGHAGCEAAFATSRKGLSTLLVTLHPDSIAQMSCNPAIGGTAKGQIVREIDALGGEMAKITDYAGLQFRMLNLSRGPAVWSPRAQCDKRLYHGAMTTALESQENLDILQAEAVKVSVKNNRVAGIETRTGLVIEAGAVIVTTGTFMRGLIHVGMSHFPGGRFNEPSSEGLSSSLERECGLEIKRLKTGTPPRINDVSIDFSGLERQPGDEPPAPFSHFTDTAAWQKTKRQLPCWLTYTNTETHRIIRDNLGRSPLYCGLIKSTGPRYCPSIEDKVVRFSQRERHQVFLEPEGYETREFYANGISTSLPHDVQQAMVHSIKGLENAKIMRYGYAIEYDYCPPTQLYPTLETKTVENLFLAGQVNGTTGYEEAAGQGLMAGINAAHKLQNAPAFVLRRDEAYLGVLIDDLVTKGVDEPYRMFTARAEYRLMLRSDNADLRLMEYGRRLGLIPEAFFRRFEAYRAALAEYTAKENITVSDDELSPWNHARVRRQAEFESKYAGYIARQTVEAGKLRKMENKTIPASVDYGSIPGLSTETREKFRKVRPLTLGQAARISGVTPADVALLSIHLKNLKNHIG